MVKKDYRSKAHTVMEMCSPGTMNNVLVCTTSTKHSDTIQKSMQCKISPTANLHIKNTLSLCLMELQEDIYQVKYTLCNHICQGMSCDTYKFHSCKSEVFL